MKNLRKAFLVAAVAALAGLGLITTSPADAAPTPTGPPTAATASSWPWISVHLTRSVSGRTMTFHYADAGYQYRSISDEGDLFFSTESGGYQIDFGDGHGIGANGGGGSICTSATSGPVHRFQDRTPTMKHRYAKAGTYRVKVTGYYCGVGGQQSRTVTYSVTVR